MLFSGYSFIGFLAQTYITHCDYQFQITFLSSLCLTSLSRFENIVKFHPVDQVIHLLTPCLVLEICVFQLAFTFLVQGEVVYLRLPRRFVLVHCLVDQLPLAQLKQLALVFDLELVLVVHELLH